ncbi:hypothetical protein ADIARSV_2035 [Arcticibacter svalbardensis MN12-7]|uniref:Uncharacterized protein n=1 Tax=Arcticibacter svalbardensis MN12-7 TaxID=1150600 RepID=R9H0R9_9SPHI|nr:hypothetical protein ADIARSV_2035 [Arcticibacter svalbardensis MN12-7]
MSILPKVVRLCWISCLQSSSFDTSHCTAIAFTAYFCSISWAISQSVTYCRAPNTRLAPCRANSSAHDLPIPDEAPVIMTVLFLRFKARFFKLR